MNKIHRFKALKGNVIDVAIILIVLSLLLGCYIRVNQKRISMILTDYETAEILFEFSSEETIRPVKIGQKVYNTYNNEKIGTVKEVDAVYESEYVAGENKILSKNYTDRIVGYKIEVDASVKSDETGTYINANTFIAPGSVLNLVTEDDFYFSATAIKINQGN